MLSSHKCSPLQQVLGRVSAGLAILGLSLLSACQSTINLTKDCQSGDWQLIGRKDGGQGLVSQFDERKNFCARVEGAKFSADSAQLYARGWQDGNQIFWSNLGHEDGKAGKAIQQLQVRQNSDLVKENKTPLNPAAYQQGWQKGNADYWYLAGTQDGEAGASASILTSRAQQGQQIGFNEQAFREGWASGNFKYWQNLGKNDAANGVSDRELQQHINLARGKDLTVRSDAYQQAYDLEIVQYWRRLAWDDAVSGVDIHGRREFARSRGLKFSEAEYQANWEKRLQAYWQEVGAKDGYGHPDRLEERMANAVRDKVFVIAQTRELYSQAWRRENQRYCTVDNAFEWGRNSSYMAVSVCDIAIQYRLRQALNAGADYEQTSRRLREVQRERHTVQKRIDELRGKVSRLEQENKRDQDKREQEKREQEKKRDQNDKSTSRPSESSSADIQRRERERNDMNSELNQLYPRQDKLRNEENRLEDELRRIKRSVY